MVPGDFHFHFNRADRMFQQIYKTLNFLEASLEIVLDSPRIDLWRRGLCFLEIVCRSCR